jgi:hypothetical protein
MQQPSVHLDMSKTALVLLIPLFLAGCLGNSGPSNSFIAVELGSEAVYRGSDGSTLTVVVKEQSMRRDAYLRSHEAVILEWTYAPRQGRAEAPFRFQEAVAVQSGLIVHQIAFCGILDGPLSGPFGCHDDRVVVITSGGGLPGGFGMAPLWARQDPQSVSLYPVDALVNAESVAWELAQVPMAGSDCTSVRGTLEGPARTLPWTFTNESFSVCGASPWPQAFTVGKNPILSFIANFPDSIRFVLESWVPGTDPISWGKGPNRFGEPSKSLTPTKAAAPSYVAGFAAGLEFPPLEAHQQALDRVPEYARIMSRAGIVEEFEHFISGGLGLTGELATEKQTDVRLVATDETGKRIRVDLTKTSKNTLGIPSSTYQVDTVANTGPVTTPQKEAARIDLLAAMKLGAELGGGLPFVYQSIGFSHDRDYNSTTTWTYKQDLPRRTSGYELHVGFEDPRAVSGEVVVFYPYSFLMDGKTGAVLHLDARPSALPF